MMDRLAISAIAAGAILCGRIGYKSITQWAQAFVVERKAINKKIGKVSRELTYGITSQISVDASAAIYYQA